MSTPEQQEMSMDIETAEKQIKIYEALMRLKSNVDFNIVSEDQYLTSSVLDSVSLLAHDSMVDKRDRINEDIMAASNLKFFLLRVEKQGEVIKENLDLLRSEQFSDEIEEINDLEEV